MTSLYEVLKRSKTAPQLAPDMFTALWAKSITAGKTIELSGQVPLSFKANGAPLIDYTISGNMEQSGTPTPDAPIIPQGTGERTENLFDKSKRTDNSRVVYTTGEIGSLSGVFVSDFIPIEPNTTYTLNIVSSISGKTGHLYALYDVNKNFVDTGAHAATPATEYTFTTPSDIAYIRFNGNMASVDEIMLNPGSTALPYEPYGIKIPILSAGQTNNIYLGEVQTTRKIRKLVLTGNTTDGMYGITPQSIIYITPLAGLINRGALCTHYESTTKAQGTSMPLNSVTTHGGAGFSLWFRTEYTTVTDFKSYLAQQYANGTPVCVWYVLANEETGIVNEPLCKIGDYADTVSKSQAGVSIPTNNGSTTIDVDSTFKPSEVYIKYHTR